MNLIMISIDSSILMEGSKTKERLIEYSKILDSLSVIVFSKKGFKNFKLGENINIYPSNSLMKINFIYDAYRIGKEICKDFDKNTTVITTQDPFETGLIGYLLKHKLGFGLNIQVHTNPFSKFFKKESVLNYLRYLFFRFFLLYRVNSIRTVNKSIKDTIYRINGMKNIINIPIYSEIKINKKINKNSKEFNILCLSRLETVKNIGLVLDAINTLSPIYKNIKLTIVGKGSLEETLRKYIINNGLEEKVIIKPWTNNVGDEYRGSDLFILSSNYEGWGMTIIEATSYGIPIIMTNTGCAGDFLINGYNGIVIDIGNKKQLELAIIKMYEDAHFLENCIKNGFEQLKQLPNKEESLKMYMKSWEMALSDKK